MSDKTCRVIDFKTRRLIENINDPMKKVSQEVSNEVAYNAMSNGIIRAFSEENEADKSKIATALEVLNDSIHDVTHRGARAFLICEKLDGKWIWKWANLDSDPTDLIAAIRPVYEGAINAVKQLENKQLNTEENKDNE